MTTQNRQKSNAKKKRKVVTKLMEIIKITFSLFSLYQHNVYKVIRGRLFDWKA